jgi:hypothetical protein
MRESRTYGSVRGARDETRVPTATALPAHVLLLHLLTTGHGTSLPSGDVRFHGGSWKVTGPLPAEPYSPSPCAKLLVKAGLAQYDPEIASAWGEHEAVPPE